MDLLVARSRMTRTKSGSALHVCSSRCELSNNSGRFRMTNVVAAVAGADDAGGKPKVSPVGNGGRSTSRRVEGDEGDSTSTSKKPGGGLSVGGGPSVGSEFWSTIPEKQKPSPLGSSLVHDSHSYWLAVNANSSSHNRTVTGKSWTALGPSVWRGPFLTTAEAQQLAHIYPGRILTSGLRHTKKRWLARLSQNGYGTRPEPLPRARGICRRPTTPGALCSGCPNTLFRVGDWSLPIPYYEIYIFRGIIPQQGRGEGGLRHSSDPLQ